jgi:hypothetical protein
MTTSEIWFFIITTIIGLITWPIFIKTLCEFDGEPKMSKTDWISSICFGLCPIINIVPFGCISMVFICIILPRLCYNKIKYGKFELEI